MPWKNIIVTAFISALLIAYLVVSTGFVEMRQHDLACNAVDIRVCDSLTNSFIRPADIAAIIEQDGVKTIGDKIIQMNIYQLEQRLNKRSVIKNTEAYVSIDGVLHIRVYQRRPIMRVQSPGGSFYIDDSGYIFPLSGVHTSYVPVMTGNVPISFAGGYRGEIPANEKFLQQTYDFALFLDDDKFWQSQVTQLYVKNATNVEIIPRVGEQRICLGTLDNYNYKLRKLQAFYRKACPAGEESNYSVIDLRYGNQIVCTRK